MLVVLCFWNKLEWLWVVKGSVEIGGTQELMLIKDESFVELLVIGWVNLMLWSVFAIVIFGILVRGRKLFSWICFDISEMFCFAANMGFRIFYLGKASCYFHAGNRTERSSICDLNTNFCLISYLNAWLAVCVGSAAALWLMFLDLPWNWKILMVLTSVGKCIFLNP